MVVVPIFTGAVVVRRINKIRKRLHEIEKL